jgi:hypothetical protein
MVGGSFAAFWLGSFILILLVCCSGIPRSCEACGVFYLAALYASAMPRRPRSKPQQLVEPTGDQ